MPSDRPSQRLDLGRHQRAVDTALARLDKQRLISRLLSGDPTLWKDGEDHARVIANRLGWLRIAGAMASRVEQMRSFAQQVVDAGTRHVVLLGMGGSSLCPEVLRRTFTRRPGFPALLVLDSTDPESIAAVERAIDPRKSFFIVSSKSGTTIESQMLMQYFAARAPASRFAAITDAGTPLEALARERGFARVFTNPSDIGGRYSALSFFGMVPAACLGLDVARLLRRGDEMARTLDPVSPPAACEPVALGAALGALGLAGRDKITFCLAPRIAGFGTWAEQLIAESTGKEGQGLVPVEGEELGPPSRYGKDRLFVRMTLRGSGGQGAERRLAALAREGHPRISIALQNAYDLGAEFVRWEIAVAVASSIMGVDPFDEPNVKESKDNTARVLERHRATGSLPEEPLLLDKGGVRAFAAGGLDRRPAPRTLAQLMTRLCRAARRGKSYIGLMAYLRMDATTSALTQRIRMKLREACGVATTVGFGPRFLHSTGQLHKGGPPRGLFIQITSDKRIDLPIPGEGLSFGVLQAAQAAGDYQSLAGRGLRILRLHLRDGVPRGLERILASVPSSRPRH